MCETSVSTRLVLVDLATQHLHRALCSCTPAHPRVWVLQSEVLYILSGHKSHYAAKGDCEGGSNGVVGSL